MVSVESFFAPGGKLAHSHPGYEYRRGQHEMARNVESILEEGGSLMVEAGTGTGKTLAYLVPAVLSGRRVIVSTGTRNLQDQIFRKDIPFLRKVAGLDFRATLMKGRDNYVCRYRMDQFAREPMLQDIGEMEWVERIATWSEQTTSGDRAEIADLPDNLKLWRDVNARSETCGGTRCPEFENCWLTRLKRESQQAQIVVVNHHLFFADLSLRSSFGSVLPDYDSVIFDEAHLLEEIATLYFGARVSSAGIEEVARSAERLAAKQGGPVKGGGGAAGLREASAEFFLPLRERLRGDMGRARFDPADRGGPDLEGEWAVLSHALDEVVRESAESHGDEQADTIAQRAEELRDGFDRVLERTDPAFVYGMELRGRGSVTLSAAPIDVSEPLRESLFDRLHACVLTSATLAVGQKMDFFLERLGLVEPQTRVVDSSFDHRNQAALYLPRRMPEPRDHDFIDRSVEEIERLLEVTEGRAFLLFTSYHNMQRVHQRLEDDDRWPLLMQGEGSKVSLVESFCETPRAVLLGTASFWHGVDVPGAALSLVVVDKLPFDVPSDPLIAARIDRIRERGGNPFYEYQTPLAVLQLKQGLGRLIRSGGDRGILSVLDPRLTTRRYGKLFLDSLPPYRQVRSVEDAAAFFLDDGPP